MGCNCNKNKQAFKQAVQQQTQPAVKPEAKKLVLTKEEFLKYRKARIEARTKRIQARNLAAEVARKKSI